MPNASVIFREEQSKCLFLSYFTQINDVVTVKKASGAESVDLSSLNNIILRYFAYSSSYDA